MEGQYRAAGHGRLIIAATTPTQRVGADSSFFADNAYIDRGISGQTTPQMLVRFRPDVIALKPAAAVIRAEINDIVDCYSHMADERKGLEKRFSEDGVHPNMAGYKVMEPLVQDAIKRALSQ